MGAPGRRSPVHRARQLDGQAAADLVVGIRTPWTLSSAYSWNRTHRLGGWAFIGIGLMMMATCIVAQSCFVTLTVVFTAAVLIALVVYSYLTWKRDPDRVPPAGRLPA